MKKIIVSTMVSLDGIEENPQNWSFDFWNDEIQQYAYDQLFATDTLVMGRVTYEGFAEAWSARAGADEFADRINSLPKYVASRTMDTFEWNATHIAGDIPETIAKIKEEPGQNILQYGIGELTQTMLEADLIDEIRLLVYPVIVGNGQRIFENIDQTALKLLETKTFDTGVVAMHYQPVKAQ